MEAGDAGSRPMKVPEGCRLKDFDVPAFGLPEGCRLQLPDQPSLTRILRDVKRQEHSVRNCVASVVYDARTFVRDVGKAYGWPMYGNRRCGAWYVPPDASSSSLSSSSSAVSSSLPPTTKLCYFKSTDGHVNKWGFSFARLNLHVALDAVRHGGCVVVDATRRGKMFPDALSKTVPIWCAVVNTAVALYRMDASTADVPLEFDLPDLQLPPWVPDGEAAQIEKKIDTWASQLVGAGIEEFETLSREMDAPLVCVWAHPSHAGGLPEIDDAVRASSTVVVLASASVNGYRGRRSMTLDNGEEIVFDYVPGAGDDEETWGMGLTPRLMWASWERILMEPDERGFVERLVRECKDDAGDIDGVRGARGDRGDRGDGVMMTRIAGTGMSLVSRAYATKHAHELASPTTAVFNVSTRDFGGQVGCEPCALVESSTLTAGSVTTSKDCRVVELDEAAIINRYCWIANAASRKHAVVEYAPCATAFASHHLRAGRDVLFVYDPTDTSSVAAALLLTTIIALFTLHDGAFRRTDRGYAVNAATGSILPATDKTTPFSRELFRRYVANVTVHVPYIIMRKAILKESFNVFIR